MSINRVIILLSYYTEKSDAIVLIFLKSFILNPVNTVLTITPYKGKELKEKTDALNIINPE